MGVVRRAIEVVGIALLVAWGAAAAVPADVETTTASASEPVRPTSPEPVVPAALGPVTVHTVDDAVMTAAASGPASASVTEVVQLTIIGGDLTLASDHATVELTEHGGEWTVDLPPVRVVDARGTHAGWTVRWDVDDVIADGCRHAPHDAAVRVMPTEPVMVDGTADGLVAGRAGNGAGHGRVLGSAEPGWGGGTYEAGGSVSVQLSGCSGATAVVVHLVYSLD